MTGLSFDELWGDLSSGGLERCPSVQVVGGGMKVRCARALDHRGQHEDVHGTVTWWIPDAEWKGSNGRR